jgi:glutamate/tyrosine decarboxylase-like PLP-dependent enzyme
MVLTGFGSCRYRMPERSIPKEAAYQIISDELMLDGNPRLNLASFVTTWMESECDKLIMDSINKNYVDMDEYPVTTELQVPTTGSQISCFSIFYILPLSVPK